MEQKQYIFLPHIRLLGLFQFRPQSLCWPLSGFFSSAFRTERFGKYIILSSLSLYWPSFFEMEPSVTLLNDL